jgi:5-methylcytosine-specific restriction protein A
MSETDELKFLRELTDLVARIKKETNYTPSEFLNMLHRNGAINTAKTLIRPGSRESDGYQKLWEKNRLDLTVENVALQPQWQHLFTRDELKNAQKRLQKYKFDQIPEIVGDSESSAGSNSTKQPWSLEHLDLCVSRYLGELLNEQAGKAVNKQDLYRELEAQTSHSSGSVRQLFQNISHELEQKHFKILTGVSPLSGSSSKLRNIIDDRIQKLYVANSAEELEEKSAILSLRSGPIPEPIGNPNPRRISMSSTQIERRADVVRYIKDIADGTCECCGNAAPFKDALGKPYLEVHHVVRLTDGGPDIPSNAIAVCPNCHRALHYSGHQNELKEKLYKTVARLKRN